MKIMPPTRGGFEGNPNVPSGKNGVMKIQEPIDPEDIQQHMQKLRNISAVAAKLFILLGEHINFISSVAPIERGRETVRLRPTPVSLCR